MTCPLSFSEQFFLMWYTLHQYWARDILLYWTPDMSCRQVHYWSLLLYFFCMCMPTKFPSSYNFAEFCCKFSYVNCFISFLTPLHHTVMPFKNHAHGAYLRQTCKIKDYLLELLSGKGKSRSEYVKKYLL